MKSNNVIGVDIGYGYTKICAERLSRVFPSQVARLRPRSAFGTEPNIIIVDNHPFVVGNEIDKLGDYSVGTEFIGTPQYLALLGRALSMAKNPCDTLVMGLPPGLYEDARIAKLKKIIAEAELRNGDGSPIPVPKTVKYIPQGAGIYFDYLNSQPTAQANKNYVIIDIGSFTLDFVLFNEEGKYQDGAARSYPLGISTLLNEIKVHFSKIHGVFLNNDENALKLIREGSYTHFGRTYHLDVNSIMEEYLIEKVIKTMRNYQSELRDKTVNMVVMGGGGVSCIGQLLVFAHIVDEPQMSNARGFYIFGRKQVDAQPSRDEKASAVAQMA